MNILVGSLLLMILPVTYFLLRSGASPEIVLCVNIIPWVIAIPIRLVLLYRYCKFPILSYIKKVILLGAAIAILCFLYRTLRTLFYQ